MGTLDRRRRQESRRWKRKQREPDPDRPLIMAEGVESALSAAELTGLPAISAIAAGNMKEITSLPPCSEVIIAVDNDNTGRKEAEAAAAVGASRQTGAGLHSKELQGLER